MSPVPPMTGVAFAPIAAKIAAEREARRMR